MHRRARLLAVLTVGACAGPPPTPPPTPGPVALPTPWSPARDSVVPPPADTTAFAWPEQAGAPASPGPLLRIGLDPAGEVTLGAGGAVRVTSPSGRLLALVPARSGWRLEPGGRGVRLLDPHGRVQATDERLAVLPEDAARVAVGASSYRGSLEVLTSDGRLQVINAVQLEDYLPSVVAAEIGNRTPAEREAVMAQAIVARTYALRNRGRWAARGYDLLAGTGDQVYRGLTAELPLAEAAVRATSGLVLTWDGAPIDAFFSSTCGGHTEDGVAVFAGADRPYLVGRPDVDPAGRAWCADSPRYRWRERWTAAELEAALRTGLPAVGQRAAEGAVRDLRVGGTSPSGRVMALAIRYRAANVSVEGQNPVRRALPPPGASLLRSARFTLEVHQRNGMVESVVAEGGGAGHGVGLCQWGAIGRARAGHRATEILAAYYPGTTLVRWY